MRDFFEKASMQQHPLRVLETFLEQEQANEQARNYDALRIVGYVLEIGYDIATIITSDPLKVAVGGVPRNSLLIMVPSNPEKLPWHFTLLRVLESAPTPLTKEVQQTYFELQKKSMPELDVFTQSELQWGALKTEVLGMFYPHPEQPDAVEFSGDVNNFISAHKYKVYAPDAALLDLIINSIVPRENRTDLGYLRLTECRLPLPDKPTPKVTVFLSTKDFQGTRTAMFGKTRLGKSNVVKLLAQSLIEATAQVKNVGQLIFDIDGEYANDNPQHNSLSLKSGYSERCSVYAVTKKEATESKPLKLNFYEQPESSLPILRSLLLTDKRDSIYIQSFASVNLASLEELGGLDKTGGDFTRALRKVQMFWAILRSAGYDVNERQLYRLAPQGTDTSASKFDPGYAKKLRLAAYNVQEEGELPEIQSLGALDTELRTINQFRRNNKNNKESMKLLQSSSGNPTFEADDAALLDFLDPVSGSGPSVIRRYTHYHASDAGNFVEEILKLLDAGETVILDLGNADPEIMTYFSKHLSTAVFQHQVEKFTNNQLGDHYIQVYFEEAHNLFPYQEDPTTIYNRFAKQGAKFHIGMVYSTQSPTTISKDLLAQTENFFVAHLSSQEEVNALAKVNTAYSSIKDDILRAKTPGYMRMLTRSHRFVISVQAKVFMPPAKARGRHIHAL